MEELENISILFTFTRSVQAIALQLKTGRNYQVLQKNLFAESHFIPCHAIVAPNAAYLR
jgi:hypothetical protein